MRNQAHDNDPRFVEYYAQQSLSEETIARADGILRAIMRIRTARGDSVTNLMVADIGCNAGTQSRRWLEQGHQVRGVDISADLVELARARNADFGTRAQFEIGSATALPWAAGQFDVCLLPELLEHVDDWQTCLSEAARVLKPGGSVFLSTTNVLCPVQQEFTLPLYSWYPRKAKEYCVRRARTDAPQWANFVTYPAVHWFSPYQLKAFMSRLGVEALDRFDVMDSRGRGLPVRFALSCIRTVPPLRFFAHILTPSTIIIGRKFALPP